MKVELKPNSYLYPQPVLIIGSYDDNNVPDIKAPDPKTGN